MNSYPMRLQLMFDSFNSTSGLANYTPDMPESFKEDFPDDYIPPKFARYHLYSSFLINFGNTLMALAIFFGAWVCFLPIDQFIFIKSHPSFRSIRMAIQNLCITQLYSNFGDIILFFILDVKSSSMSSFVTVLSLLTSIFFA